MQQRLDIRQEQKLVMTPQLQMAIKLLQMPTQDLHTFVGQELMENPFLSQDDGTNEVENAPVHHDEQADTLSNIQTETMDGAMEALDTGWDNVYDSGRGASGQMSASLDEDGLQAWERTASEDKSLRDHLLEQLGVLDESPTTQFVCRFLIDSIDDAGYFRGDLEEVSARLQVALDVVEDALELLQTFEPAGIAARDLKECLSLQLELECKLKGARLEQATAVVQHLELMAQRDFKKLARLAKCSQEEVLSYCEIISTLTPKPGLQYGSDVSSNVIPDVVVSKGDAGWRAELNVDALPKVLLNQGIDKIFAKAREGEKEYMNERANRANWLVKSLEQRARTIFKVASAIVDVQEDFFNYGVESLQPLTLKMVAERVEVHESTVSRVTNGKFMQTPMGVFEMKYFFSSAINTTGGQVSVAAESVKSMIKRLIGDEDAAKPLSDEKLVQLLKAEGVDVARRTVAKYREALGIMSSSKRRIRS